eukprot:3055927-Pleurochrysis_carterae.AAC.1
MPAQNLANQFNTVEQEEPKECSRIYQHIRRGFGRGTPALESVAGSGFGCGTICCTRCSHVEATALEAPHAAALVREVGSRCAIAADFRTAVCGISGQPV